MWVSLYVVLDVDGAVSVGVGVLRRMQYTCYLCVGECVWLCMCACACGCEFGSECGCGCGWVEVCALSLSSVFA